LDGDHFRCCCYGFDRALFAIVIEPGTDSLSPLYCEEARIAGKPRTMEIYIELRHFWKIGKNQSTELWQRFILF